LAVEYAFTELGYTLDGPVGALLGWTAANAEAVRRSQAEFDRDLHLDDAV
jgi:DNA-binding HxlR family transcriptional regulator